MQLTEHQDFQLMLVRGEFIETSSILAEPGKGLFRCRGVYISRAPGKATDMMWVAMALVTVLGFIALRPVKAGNPENSQSARINSHEPSVAIGLPFAVRSRLSGVFLVHGVAVHLHLGMAFADNLRDLRSAC